MKESHLKVATTELRTRFAERLSALYGNEVPLYRTLVETSKQVNERVVTARGADAERLGTIDRVTAERHGAIRVGSPREMAQVSRIFAALGMFPCGFYDLRDAQPKPVPVVSTAFRPLDRHELAANPFRMFTSMLVPEDRRFFGPELAQRLKRFIDARELFPPALLKLADRAVAYGGLSEDDSMDFLDLASEAFAISPEPVDRAWYSELEKVSSVAADIGGVTSTHINHLTPRVLDIDDLYRSMVAQGVQMIDEIQGPPRWDGPEVLLRQTSFRALAEPRRFREVDGSVTVGDLRVRFGEVEARGVALTHTGRNTYDELAAQIDEELAAAPGEARQDLAARAWRTVMPATDLELCAQGLAFYTFDLSPRANEGRLSPEEVEAIRIGRLDGMLKEALVTPSPIVYEDFLPRSAAGIFASNLSGDGVTQGDQGGADRDLAWMSDVVGTEIQIPEDVYEAESNASLDAVTAVLRSLAGL